MTDTREHASSGTGRSCLAVVLAAGEGTRMRSARAKVLHEIAGRSLLGHVLAAVREAGASQAAVVVGPDRDDVAREARKLIPEADIFVKSAQPWEHLNPVLPKYDTYPPGRSYKPEDAR